jgi:putative acetyltransferase
MIPDDVEAVGQVWLAASLKAHDFVPEEFWHADHKVMVSKILPVSHGYVHETNGEIDGFVVLGSGEKSNFMEALFVRPQDQGQGIGTQLLNHVKAMRNPLKTNVYKKNQRSFEFYKSRGFRVVGETICKHTGCEGHELEWNRSPNQACL